MSAPQDAVMPLRARRFVLPQLQLLRYRAGQQGGVVGGGSRRKQTLLRLTQLLAAPLVDATTHPCRLLVSSFLPFQGFREMGGVANMGLSKELEAWRQRVCWLRRQETAGGGASALPDLSDEALMAMADKWLKPHLAGKR